jgi:NADP-dependent 3-hydroxy acid dehydrogenase YdfG
VTTVDPGLVETEFSRVRFYGNDERARKVYEGYRPLSGSDIAEAVLWAAVRPDHVQVAEIMILPTAQASSTLTHRT